MKERVYANEILIEALFYMQMVHHRRSITASELRLYQNHIIEESLKQGKEIEIIYDQTDAMTTLRSLVDTIIVDGQTVYRISPSTPANGLAELAQFYRSKHNAVIPGMNAPLFISRLNDFNRYSERACPEFQKVDERYQLNTMYQIYQLEQQKRKLEQTLGVIKSNAISQVDDVLAESLMEENADISISDFISKMGR